MWQIIYFLLIFFSQTYIYSMHYKKSHSLESNEIPSTESNAEEKTELGNFILVEEDPTDLGLSIEPPLKQGKRSLTSSVLKHATFGTVNYRF